MAISVKQIQQANLLCDLDLGDFSFCIYYVFMRRCSMDGCGRKLAGPDQKNYLP